MSEARLAAVAFEGVNPILRVEDINAAVDHYTWVLGFKQIGRAREAFGRCRAVGVISFCAKVTKVIQVLGSGLEWKMLTRCSRSTAGRSKDPAPANELSLGLRNAGRRYRRQCAAPWIRARKTNRSRAWLDMHGRHWIRLPEGGYKGLD